MNKLLNVALLQDLVIKDVMA